MKYFKDEYWERFTKIVSQNDRDKKIRDGLEFEDLVESLLRLEFQGEWTRTKKTHDNNRDFYLYSELERIWVECKNYKTSIAMSTLAPTLVMAQIFDVSQIIFFSYSKISNSAKRKIFSFGRKVNKKIRIYDDYRLEELIIKAGNRLPVKFRPSLTSYANSSCKNNLEIQLFARIEPTTSTDEKMSDFIPYKKLSKVYYNKVFAMYFFLTNTSALEAYSIKVHTKENQSEDIFHYQFVDRDILEPAVFSKNTMIDSAEGVVLECLMKPIIYKKNIKLPVFVIEIWNNKNNLIYTWQNDPLYLECVWVGQTKLIGSNYEKIINTISNKVLARNKIGVCAIYGESGTGKTRLLTELMEILLQQRYRILNFIGLENDQSLNIIKEIVYYIYEIPRSTLTEYWEKHILEIKSIKEPGDTVFKALSLLGKIITSSSSSVIDEYYDIIFEKISHMNVALIFDNVQYYNEKIITFIQKYIHYAVNQNCSNQTVILCTFNTDFLNRSSCDFFNDIRFLEKDIDSIYIQEIKGFNDSNQALLYLRELVHLNTDENDRLLSDIIQKLTTKPYYLYQAIKYLEENNAIYHSPLEQGFLIDNSVFREVIEKMPNNLTELLIKRYSSLNYDFNHINMVLSAVYIFVKIDSFIIRELNLNTECINFLKNHGFLRQLPNRSYTFEHDIIRSFLSEYIVSLEKYIIDYIISEKLLEQFITFPFQYSFILLHKKRLTKKIFQEYIASIEEEDDIPLYLYNKYYKKLFDSAIKRMHFFDTFLDWMKFLYNICKNVRDKLGSEIALEYYYQPLYNILKRKIKECYKYLHDYRLFIMSYTDLLLHLKMNNKAIAVLEKELKSITDNENNLGNSAITFEAILCNRLHVNYKDFSDKKSQLAQKKYLEMSEEKAKKIFNINDRNLLEFLNASDKGYCYYSFNSNRDKIIKEWGKCLNFTPEILPEKTMNFYRKSVQLNLINNEFDQAIKNIEIALDYLETGEHAHERLIFKYFFQISKCIAYIQKDPIRYQVEFEDGIYTATILQEILNNGKKKDIYNLKAVFYFYCNSPNEMFLNFKEGYKEYNNNCIMTNYKEKFELYIDNIIYAFYKMHIWGNNLFQTNFLLENDRINRFLNMSETQKKSYIFYYEAHGLIRTKDFWFNLPLI